jgi:hypothetical protein
MSKDLEYGWHLQRQPMCASCAKQHVKCVNACSHLYPKKFISTKLVIPTFQIQRLVFQIIVHGTAMRGRAADQIHIVRCWSPYTQPCTVLCGGLGKLAVSVFVNAWHI